LVCEGCQGTDAGDSFPFNSEEAASLRKSTDVSIENRNVPMRSIGSFITSTER